MVGHGRVELVGHCQQRFEKVVGVDAVALLPHPLFADAFESGGTTHWSLRTP